MSPEEKLEMGRKLIAEAEAEILLRLTQCSDRFHRHQKVST